MRPGPKTRRGKYYDYLRRAGFLDFEAMEFSKRPELRKTEYFNRLVVQRRAALLNVRKQHKQASGEPLNTDSKAYRAYAKRIQKIYDAKGYKQRILGKTQQLRLSPWALLKAVEDEWKDKNGSYYQYISPFDRKRRVEDKDIRKIEKGYKQKALFD